MELFDLTEPLGPDVPVQAGDPAFSLIRTSTHEVTGYEVTQICLGSHTGTHVDAPRHLYPLGKTLDQFALDRLVGPGVVLDCRDTSNGTIDEVIRAQLRLYPVPRDCRVLLWTEGALLNVEAARLLVQAGVGVIATDAPSLDEEPYPVHRFLLSKDVLIVENLRGLERLGPGPIGCAFLPLALVGTDGAPLRAVAWRATE